MVDEVGSDLVGIRLSPFAEFSETYELGRSTLGHFVSPLSCLELQPLCHQFGYEQWQHLLMLGSCQCMSTNSQPRKFTSVQTACILNLIALHCTAANLQHCDCPVHQWTKHFASWLLCCCRLLPLPLPSVRLLGPLLAITDMKVFLILACCCRPLPSVQLPGQGTQQVQPAVRPHGGAPHWQADECH